MSTTADFNIGDQVSFTAWAKGFTGKVEKVGRKNLTIRYTKGSGTHLFTIALDPSDPKTEVVKVGEQCPQCGAPKGVHLPNGVDICDHYNDATTVATVSKDGSVLVVDDVGIRKVAAEAWATHPNNPERERTAVVVVPPGVTHFGAIQILNRVSAYLPSAYSARWAANGNDIEIVGRDSAGWTLDGYVIPRLASGLIFAKEVVSA
jgi:hypothetical protein